MLIRYSSNIPRELEKNLVIFKNSLKRIVLGIFFVVMFLENGTIRKDALSADFTKFWEL